MALEKVVIFGINYLTCHCQVCLIFSRLILMNFYVRSEVLSDLITVDIIHKLMGPEDHSHHIVQCFQNQGESFCFNGDQFKFVPFQPIGSNSKEGFLFLWIASEQSAEQFLGLVKSLLSIFLQEDLVTWFYKDQKMRLSWIY